MNPKCELIIAHNDVIESYLLHHVSENQPEVIGNDFLIVATLELAYWNLAKDNPGPLPDFIPHMSDIQEHLVYECRLV